MRKTKHKPAPYLYLMSSYKGVVVAAEKVAQRDLHLVYQSPGTEYR